MMHPTQKYGCTEAELWNELKGLPPVYEGRVAKGKIIFDAGDVRSTVDDGLRELRASGESYSRSSNLFEVLEVNSKTPCAQLPVVRHQQGGDWRASARPP